MSQAEELLDSVYHEEIMPMLSNPETEPHIVIGDDRVIVVPNELKRIAVQYDHDVETVTFDCPRYWDEHDMSKMGIYINYIRKDMIKGMYRANNVVVDANDDRIMHFDWTISRNVSQVKGGIKFLVCVKKMDDEGYEQNHWNSELNEEMYVSEGLECEESVFEPYPDIVSQWATDVEEVKRILLDARDAGELNGATFIPSVTEDGDLSWTNDKGFANPETVNIHGFAPKVNVVEIDGGHQVTITDVDGDNTVNIMDGVDAISPTIESVPIDGGYRITVDGVNGTSSFDLLHGVDAVSPTITSEVIAGGYRITVSGVNGTQSFDLMDGVTPTIDVTDADGNHSVSITDVNGTKSYSLLNGVSPVLSVESFAGGHRVTVTDVNGTETFEVLNGGTEAIGEYVNNSTATDAEITEMLNEILGS